MTVAATVALLDRRYPPDTAADWDAVGLVCGWPDSVVRRVLFAIDPTPEVVAEALTLQAELLVTHHPLFLRGIHGVPATSWKGQVVHELIARDMALFCAHTNADVAQGGVSDALATALGLVDIEPLPSDAAQSQPRSGNYGLGRVGKLPAPLSLAEFAATVAQALPTTAAGIRVAGELARPVQTVAVCGGAGDDLLDEVRRIGVDAYVTADLRHHLVAESMLASGPALIDPGHWATEWPWLAVASQRLTADARADGATVEVAVSSVVTDPWSGHFSFES